MALIKDLTLSVCSITCVEIIVSNLISFDGTLFPSIDINQFSLYIYPAKPVVELLFQIIMK